MEKISQSSEHVGGQALSSATWLAPFYLKAIAFLAH